MIHNSIFRFQRVHDANLAISYSFNLVFVPSLPVLVLLVTSKYDERSEIQSDTRGEFVGVHYYILYTRVFVPVGITCLLMNCNAIATTTS